MPTSNTLKPILNSAYLLNDLPKYTGVDYDELLVAAKEPRTIYQFCAQLCNLEHFLYVNKDLDTVSRTCSVSVAQNQLNQIKYLLRYYNEAVSQRISQACISAADILPLSDDAKFHVRHFTEAPPICSSYIRSIFAEIATINIPTKRVTFKVTNLTDTQKDLVKFILKNSLELIPYGDCRDNFFICCELLLDPAYRAIPNFTETVDTLCKYLWAMARIDAPKSIKKNTALDILAAMPDNHDRELLTGIFMHCHVIPVA